MVLLKDFDEVKTRWIFLTFVFFASGKIMYELPAGCGIFFFARGANGAVMTGKLTDSSKTRDCCRRVHLFRTVCPLSAFL